MHIPLSGQIDLDKEVRRMTKGMEIALSLLPPELKTAALEQGTDVLERGEEFRLRRGHGPTLLLPEGERELCRRQVGLEDIAYVMDRATLSSLHSVAAELRRGYVSFRGGVRVGVCGESTAEGGALRDFSSLSIRVPRQIFGVGGSACAHVASSDGSALIISPPGGGKTTLLRELIRVCASCGIRVGVADERGELAAVWQGQPQLDVGRSTDIISGGRKADTAMMLLRGMNVQIIAMDEISAPEDVAAVEQIANCGVRIFASAHASGVEELKRRPLYRKMLELGVFRSAIVISAGKGGREYREETLW